MKIFWVKGPCQDKVLQELHVSFIFWIKFLQTEELQIKCTVIKISIWKCLEVSSKPKCVTFTRRKSLCFIIHVEHIIYVSDKLLTPMFMRSWIMCLFQKNLSSTCKRVKMTVFLMRFCRASQWSHRRDCPTVSHHLCIVIQFPPLCFLLSEILREKSELWTCSHHFCSLH